MNQKDIFLASEGDAWFTRNHQAVAARRLPEDDAVLCEVIGLPLPADRPRVLEVGCGEGARLGWLAAQREAMTFGVEPSARAVDAARARGVDARQGTAETLPFESASMDVIIFGFCLYLCDPADLFAIAAEANRVLRAPGWMIIEDFFSPGFVSREYHHRPGVRSRKMDYRSLFTWHPQYLCVAHRVRHHATGGHTDDPQEWVGVSVLRKGLPLA